MITIIEKHDDHLRYKVYRAECPKCHSLLDFNESDIIPGNNYKLDAHVVCPNCNGWVTEDRFVEYPLKLPNTPPVRVGE